MFELPELPFDKHAFCDWSSAETFDFHHGKHHAGYVSKLNASVLGTEFEGTSLEEVIAGSRGAHPSIYNLASQHFNHSFFWEGLSTESMTLDSDFLVALEKEFGSLDAFKLQFSTVAAKHFGSGWTWLVREPDGKLAVKDFHDADTPAYTGDTPLLTLDVWEHAYYIDHRNDRARFVDGFWEHVNWGFVAEQFG
jgi:superoxide dismutase, Fe-Mn family